MNIEPVEPQKRLPRYRRHKSRRLPFALQARDHAIVRLVGEYRLITSAEILAIVPGSAQGILRRLQKLYHAGYLERPPDQRQLGNVKMVYGLGNLGAQLIASEGRQLSVDSEQMRTLTGFFLEHALMISRFHAALILAARQRGDVAVDLWQQDRELWDRVTTDDGETIPVCPDAYFVLRLLNEPDGKNRIHVFLEADRSTMTQKRFIAKMRGYWHYRASGKAEQKFGVRNFLVLTVTKTPERAANLLAATRTIDQAPGALRMFLFGSEQSYDLSNPAPILGAIWHSPTDRIEHALTE